MRDSNLMQQATVKLKQTIAVAKKNKYQTFYIALVFFMIMIIIAGSILLAGREKPIAEKDKILESNDWDVMMKPPALTLSTNVQDKKVFKDAGKEDQDIQNDQVLLAEKIQQLRNNAPIQMYSLGTGKLANFPVDVAMTEKQEQGVKINDPRKELGNNNDFFTRLTSGKKNNSDDVRNATLLQHPEYMVLQGTLIPGVLHTAINSDLPGMVKAIVNYNVYGTAGRNLLVPKGSLLIGQYNATVTQGQNRILIIWTRLVRPDHITIALDSSATDTLGRSGILATDIDNHFFERFGEASLLSVIAAGTSNIGVSEQQAFNAASAYRMSIANGFQEAAGDSLKTQIGIKPTLNIEQGTRINVFVNHDLSFYEVLQARK